MFKVGNKVKVSSNSIESDFWEDSVGTIVEIDKDVDDGLCPIKVIFLMEDLSEEEDYFNGEELELVGAT